MRETEDCWDRFLAAWRVERPVFPVSLFGHSDGLMITVQQDVLHARKGVGYLFSLTQPYFAQSLQT